MPVAPIAGDQVSEIDEAAWRAGWELKVSGYINLIRAVQSDTVGALPRQALDRLLDDKGRQSVDPRELACEDPCCKMSIGSNHE